MYSKHPPVKINSNVFRGGSALRWINPPNNRLIYTWRLVPKRIMTDFVSLFVVVIPPAVLGGVSSIILHEFLHWIISRPFTSNLSFAIDGLHPNLQINAPYEIPAWGIRLSGATPFVVGSFITAITILLTDSLLDPSSVYLLTLGVTTAVPTMVSGGDLLAIFAPREFQKFATKTERKVPSFQESIGIIRRY